MDVQEPAITDIAILIGDPTRVTILLALLSGEALPAGALARHCRLTPQTISSHLTRLVAGHILEVIAQGRHRYYRLASPDVAAILEAMQRIAPRPAVRSLRQSDESAALSLARTCYDHLAGRLGVQIAQSLFDRDLILSDADHILLTEAGTSWCAALGIDWSLLHQQRRSFAHSCLDWSERRPHIGGAFGCALATYCFEHGWIQRRMGSRALTITASGTQELQRLFGFVMDS